MKLFKVVMVSLLFCLTFSCCSDQYSLYRELRKLMVFEDLQLDVPNIAISSTSINEDNEFVRETLADKKPNDPLGENQSPQLSWEAVEGAELYAVGMFDENANWLHWLVLDLQKTELTQGEYTSHKYYVGPYPPKNKGAHKYRIEVFALKRPTDNLILKVDALHSYYDIVRYLNRSGNGEQNILARGYIVGFLGN